MARESNPVAKPASSRPEGPEGKAIALESPIEELALSSRARNALHSLGCSSLEDVLRLDLSGWVRGIGPKTKTEVLTALRSSGLQHPELDEPRDSEIRSLDRRLERMHGRINAALGAVAREIATVRRRLRKRMDQ